MKVKISFELDLSGTHYNILSKKDISICLQNIGSWLHALHTHYLDQRLEIEFSQADEATKKAMRKHAAQDIKLSEQLFRHYQVEGIAENGQKFTFLHEEPGYKEQIIIDKPVNKEK